MRKKHLIKLSKKAKIYSDLIRFHIFDNYGVRPIIETITRINKYKGAIKKYLYYLQVSSDKVNKKYQVLPEYNFLQTISGKDSYGYESEESILNTLSYISDRFGADMRLQWLLDLPEEYKNLMVSINKV